MNRGLFRGDGPASLIPSWMGGGDPTNDGGVLVADIAQPGGASLKPVAKGHGWWWTTSNSQSIPVTTFTAVTFPAGSTQLRDTDGYHSTTVNTTRFTIPPGLGGWYAMSMEVGNGTVGGGVLVGTVWKNGTPADPLYDQNGSSPAETRKAVSGVAYLVPGDYLEAVVFTTTASWSNTTAAFSGVLIGS